MAPTVELVCFAVVITLDTSASALHHFHDSFWFAWLCGSLAEHLDELAVRPLELT